MKRRAVVVLCWSLWLGWACGVMADSSEVEKALSLKSSGQTKEAIALLEKAIARNWKDARAHYVLAWLYQGQKEREKAIEHFRKVIVLAPDSAEAREAEAALKRMGAAVTQPSSKQEKASSDKLEALKQLFEKDPATAFEIAARMFEEPRRKGDLDGMLAIIQVVEPASRRCLYAKVLDDMIDAAVPAARDSGQWEVVGQLYLARANVCAQLTNFFFLGGPINDVWRRYHFTLLAAEAYERAGKLSPWLAEQAKAAREWIRDRAVPKPGTHWHINLTMHGLPYFDAVVEIAKAQAEGRDAEAIMMGLRLLDQLPPADKDTRSADARTAEDNVIAQVSNLVRLRGAEQLIPKIRAVWRYQHALSGESLPNLAKACAMAWGGRNDVFRQCFYWAFRQWDPHRTQPHGQVANFATKLAVFGYKQEALQLVRHWLDLVNQSHRSLYLPYARGFLFPEPFTPPDMRSNIMRLYCRVALFPSNPDLSLVGRLSSIIDGVRPEERASVSLEAGLLALETAMQFPVAEMRPQGVMQAAQLFEKGGWKDLAERARALSMGIAQGDAKALLSCVVMVAQTAASEGRWQEVQDRLEPVVTAGGQEASESLLQAVLLLEQAKRLLGKAEEAAALLEKARTLVGQVGLSSGERVNYLMTLASATQDKAQKIHLLEQAKQAASTAGLELIQPKIAEQLAQVALESGDLATAKIALIDIVNQQEAKRERLAFDPLLRQQWFADSLSPYRRLLRVSALEKDAFLALSCAERMRSRALIDELAWRKVDLAVRLPKKLQQRLDALRRRRREVYALLQRVTGIGGGSEMGEGRGMYMPIRGAYIPIRGVVVLGEEQPATAEEAARLKEQIEELAREEAALESAIREAVPAYQVASQVRIPEGGELAEAVKQEPDLAVLEYTFCDEGLVVVGLRGGKAKVVLLTEAKQALWERIGKFREMLWERKQEAVGESEKLYERLVLPMEDLVGDARRLWVVAEGAIQLIPFGALRGKDGKYLAERMAIAYAPSLSLALWSRGERKRKPKHEALVVAAPDTGAVSGIDDKRGMYIPIRGMYMPIRGAYIPIRGEGGVSDALTMMAMVPLEWAKFEGESVAGMFAGSLLMSGKEATKERLWNEGSSCDVLHIATHGYADPEVPEFSGLLLSGSGERAYEVLTAHEVYLWSLQARLVTLSACQTGLGKDVEGEGVIGLTRAFIYAGARDVICSLWLVCDESTAKLMRQFYVRWLKGMWVEEALQQAQQTLLGDEATRHPFHWAGFIVMRGPR